VTKLVENVMKTQKLSTGRVLVLQEIPGLLPTKAEDYIGASSTDPRTVTVQALTDKAVRLNEFADLFYNSNREISQASNAYKVGNASYQRTIRELKG